MTPHHPLAFSHLDSSMSGYTARNTIRQDDLTYLRSLVLEYLTHHGYTNTARAFMQDTVVRELDADGDEVVPSETSVSSLDERSGLTEDDIQFTARRKDVQTLILAGRIEDAISILDTRFPSVLSSTGSPASQSASPAPTVKSEDPNAPRSFIASTSLDPSHVSLNLRILAFIEDVRTVPLRLSESASGTQKEVSSVKPPSPDPEKVPTKYIPQSHDTSSNGGIAPAAIEPEPTSTPPPPATLPTVDAERSARLIKRARKLRISAGAIPRAQDRALYDAELRNVCGLLAYSVPESAPQPLRSYLDWQRRHVVAEQINAAILYHAGKRASPRLESMARYTRFLWSVLHDRGVRVSADGPNGLLGQESDVRAPLFDLGEFLDPRKDRPSTGSTVLLERRSLRE